MSNYKIYGAIIKKEGTIGTGSTKNGNKFEEIVKELSQEVVDAQPEIIIPEVENSNITEGTLATATANRVVDMGAFNLDINTSQNLTFRANDAGNLYSRIATNGTTASIGTLDTGKSFTVGTTSIGVMLNANGSATLNLYETGDIKLKSWNGSYKIGDDSSTIPTTFSSSTNLPYQLSVDSQGYVYKTDTSALFVSDTQINPAVGGHPTITEVRNFLVGQSSALQGAAKNRVIYYTGTNTSTDAYTYAYYFTGNKELFLLDKPEEFTYPLLIAKGGQTLTSADNGVTSFIVPVRWDSYWLDGHTAKDFTMYWGAGSTGSLTINIKTAHANNTTLATVTIADLSATSGFYKFSNVLTNNIGGSNLGYYIELNGMTGDVVNFSASFTVIKGN